MVPNQFEPVNVFEIIFDIPIDAISSFLNKDKPF